MSEPTDATVLPFARGRVKRGSKAAVPEVPVALLPPALDPAPEDEGPLFDVPLVPDPAVPTSSRKPRAKTPAQRPRSRPRPQHSPEHKRALEITAIYQMAQPVCDEAKATFAIRTAILSGQWADDDIVAAVQRVADAGFPLTSNSLSYQLQKRKPGEREVDPVIHQAVDAALEHLGRLDSEAMSETEKALASALRQVCVALMHSAADTA